MPIESSVNSIFDLNALWPTAADPKSDGDDHLRMIKSILKLTFPAFKGPMPIAHDQIASKDFVTQTAFSAALPGQAGNGGKALFTDGTSASWQLVYPDQTNNVGKLLSTDGTNASWSNLLNASVIRFADGTDATKQAAFSLSGIPTGTTRTYTLPGTSGTLALRTDLPALLPTLRMQHQLASGVGAGNNLVGVNTRALNTVVKNTITGASLSSNQITLPAGTYKVRGSAPAFAAGAHQTYLYSVTDTATLIAGQSQNSQDSGTLYWDNRSGIEGEIVLGQTTMLELRHYMTAGPSTNGLGKPVSAGIVNVYAELVFEKVV